ncbi:hypothetical protein E4U15_000112 [Claviceps sp. LM218 group G6]|nr:hypothetical protein E4U15_000112 [Claviceps sp. LM218 group G6]
MELQFDDAKLFSYTDSEIRIHRLSPLYLAKAYASWDEVEDAVSAMKFASQLGIHVPHVHRIVVHDRDFYCIMDRISGRTLDAAWHELGWLSSLRLAFQLRRVVHRLRSAVSTSSGSLPTGRSVSYYLDDWFRLPDRATIHHVYGFLNFWASFPGLIHEMKKTPAEHAICARPMFSHNGPFVFTHHDLAPRNMILDTEGQLRIIDWDLAGFYPESFEYGGMHNFIDSGWTRCARWRWNLFAWIAGGLHDKEFRWLEIIRSRFRHFGAGRRCNMRAGGYASATRWPDNLISD